MSLENDLPRIGFIGYTTHDTNITPTKTFETIGGGAYFSATAAAEFLTESVGLITRVGENFDSSNLKKGISRKAIIFDPKHETALSIVTYTSETDLTAREVEIVYNTSKYLTANDIPKKWLQALKIIHIAPMLPEQQNAIVNYLRETNEHILLSIDTDISFLADEESIKIIAESFSMCDIVFVNFREYLILQAIIHQLPKAIIKLDKDGAVYLENGEVKIVVQTDRVEVVSATGAGDVLAGTFLASLLLNQNVNEALKKAVETATNFVASSKGIDCL